MNSSSHKRGLSTDESSTAKRAKTSSAKRHIEPKYEEHGQTLRERKKWAKQNWMWIYIPSRQKTSADDPFRFEILETYETPQDASNGIMNYHCRDEDAWERTDMGVRWKDWDMTKDEDQCWTYQYVADQEKGFSTVYSVKRMPLKRAGTVVNNAWDDILRFGT
ncbi:hypothetical protein BLS_001236 [Venturia inaequalis]|uniref:Uncharacterized protein n=1 Tax=Venturia inaequalis TaxID=5025 RepID=A0A8H3UYA2_VENIN|nr:hypothetical protein EG328_008527 [Venturia inaequalis]KAE9977616.1 hypothetical protein BLS_001236 [Venturia inaequalis]KAE9991206.1 hypothetical protein EG327_000327 [Venturia inaequalis]RDI84798.1 hypothetical protein Vi05172_g5498 [Venturia inaequalis]